MIVKDPNSEGADMSGNFYKKSKNYSGLSSRMSDWMRAVTSPTPYRIGSSFRVNVSKFIQNWAIMIIIVFAVMLILFSLHSNKNYDQPCRHTTDNKYNSTYPLSPPQHLLNGDIVYKIAIISDLDINSKAKDGGWISHMKKGWLTISRDMTVVKVGFEEMDYVLKSHLSLKGRAMELSELVVFNGKLYTCDDRTGVVFEVTHDNRVVPYVMLGDGDGRQTKGLKCEWMTVKNQVMWVGGLGKEWTNNEGTILNDFPQWVKSIGYHGDVRHHKWVDNYSKLRTVGGFQHPGYLIHEAVVWSGRRQQWLFLPRRASTESYNDVEDEKRAANIIFYADEHFHDVHMSTIGEIHPTKGYSSFKFIPGTSDTIIVALKSEEDEGRIASYICVLNIETGATLMPEIKIGDLKFEGIEFV